MSHRNTSLSMRRKNSMAIKVQNHKSDKHLPTGNGKGMSCSTPEPQCTAASVSPGNSDSDSASPVPFLCTQDGAYGDTEVVWNYYTPRADREQQSRTAQRTPLSRKNKRTRMKNNIGQLTQSIRPAPQPKKNVKDSEKKSQLYQDLLEMNKNIQGFLKRTQKENKAGTIQDKSGSEDDIFNSSGDQSPKLDSFTRSGSRSLRRNLLNSKYGRAEPEPALESDDSMNECLIRASQLIEEKVLTKRVAIDDDISVKKNKIEQDSMDSILNNITLDSPVTANKKVSLINDSFDNFMGNLNDSTLDKLTQLPIIHVSPSHNATDDSKSNSKTVSVYSPKLTHHGNTGWTIKELIGMDSVPSPRSMFGRHNSMPVSPAPTHRPAASVRPSTSGTALSRHSSMPWQPADREKPGSSSEDSTPMRCTPEEIKRKHQHAREKLLAKRLFPLGNTQQSQVATENIETRSVCKFQPKFPTKQVNSQQKNQCANNNDSKQPAHKVENVTSVSNGVDLKLIIEKKRKEALLKLKMKRQNNVP